MATHEALRPESFGASIAPISAAASPSATRIVGFDLARAYAIFGMFIVNFHGVFGSWYDGTKAARIVSKRVWFLFASGLAL